MNPNEPPNHYPLQPCDFKKWARYDSLPIEQACFVLLGFQPPPLEVLRFKQDTYNPSREPTWDEPPEYGDALRSLRLSIEHGNISIQRITEYPYDTQHVCWPELIRWAKLKSYAIPPEFESIVATIEPVALVPTKPKATPVVAENSPDGMEAATPNWKMQIQAEAASLFKRLRASGASPTTSSILDDMVTWCRTHDVKTDSGIYPSAGYLRTHVLGGKHWTPPR